MESDLFQRIRIVKVTNMRSDQRVIIKEVLQGLVLGPILLLFYINRIDEVFPVDNVPFYADDTTYGCANKDLNILRNKLSHIHSKQKYGSLLCT